MFLKDVLGFMDATITLVKRAEVLSSALSVAAHNNNNDKTQMMRRVPLLNLPSVSKLAAKCILGPSLEHEEMIITPKNHPL